MVFVDIDNFLSLVSMSERDGPVAAHYLIEVYRALIVTVVKSRWSNQWVDFAVIKSVYNQLFDNANVIALRLLEECNSAGRTVR
jgi:hypothetical protein